MRYYQGVIGRLRAPLVAKPHLAVGEVRGGATTGRYLHARPTDPSARYLPVTTRVGARVVICRAMVGDMSVYHKHGPQTGS
jgi:hypothetical protein